MLLIKKNQVYYLHVLLSDSKSSRETNNILHLDFETFRCVCKSCYVSSTLQKKTYKLTLCLLDFFRTPGESTQHQRLVGLAEVL